MANTLAYDTATITAVKSFTVRAPEVNALAYFATLSMTRIESCVRLTPGRSRVTAESRAASRSATTSGWRTPRPWPSVIKLFTAVIYKMSVKSYGVGP